MAEAGYQLTRLESPVGLAELPPPAQAEQVIAHISTAPVDSTEDVGAGSEVEIGDDTGSEVGPPKWSDQLE